MSQAIAKKINDQIKVLASLLGLKTEEKGAINDIDLDKEDTSFIDSIDNHKFDELMKNA